LSHRPYPLTNPLPIPADATQAEVTGLVDLGQGLLASSHLNGKVCWWDLPSQLPDEILPDCKQNLPANTIPTALEASAGEAPLVASGSDGVLYTWNRNRQLNRLKPKDGNQLSPITAMIAAGGPVVMTGHQDGSLRWHDVQGQPLSQQPVDSGYAPVETLLPLGSNRFVSAGGPPGAERLRWWRGGTPQTPEGVPFPHDRLTSMVRWTGNQIVTAGSEGSIQLWTNGKRDGNMFKTEHKTGVWSLIALRGNLFHGPTLMPGGGEGIIRLWKSDFRGSTSDSQLDHESFETGQARIMQLLEDSRGDLISGSDDGTIKVVSPRRIVKAACDLYRPLLDRPTNASEKEAAQLCACQIPETWWNLWGWVCLAWGMLS
jgi:WD40 repeat protein